MGTDQGNFAGACGIAASTGRHGYRFSAESLGASTHTSLECRSMSKAPTRPGNATERAMALLRQAIQAGQFAPGQRMIEADLMRMFDITRGPMREALRRLASERVIELVPNRGAMVRQFSRQEVADLFRIREVVEGLAARLAAESMATGSEQHNQFQQAFEDLIASRGQPDSPFSKENVGFHELILSHANNPQLTQLMRQLQLPLIRFQIRAFVDDNYRERSREEHDRIGQAILRPDPAAAETLMRAHLKQASERFLDHF